MEGMKRSSVREQCNESKGGKSGLTQAIMVFCRPTLSARRPIATRDTLFTALFTARSKLAVVGERPSTETEYVDR
jgi:hypothetical protein